MKKKMTIKDLKALFDHEIIVVPGDPNTRTRATSKGHVHKVNPSAKPVPSMSTHKRARIAKFRKLVKGA